MFGIAFCYPGEWVNPDSLLPNLRRLRALGYEAVEFWDTSVQHFGVDALAAALHSAEIACAQLCPYFNFVDGPALWDESLSIADRYLSYATRLHAPLLRVFTGKPWGEGVVGPAQATPAQWTAAIDGLQRICDMAAPRGITLALECHTGSLMEDSPNTLRLLNSVARENLVVNLQLPLADGHEPLAVSIQELGRYTRHMHIHNYTALVGGILTTLADGVISYTQVIDDLLQQGFRGYLSIEHASHGGTRDPWEIAHIEASYLHQLRATLARKGYR